MVTLARRAAPGCILPTSIFTIDKELGVKNGNHCRPSMASCSLAKSYAHGKHGTPGFGRLKSGGLTILVSSDILYKVVT
jgi:hypothetical protein